ncbi:MAG: T9SS type A sorting domain-containing protein [Bacteroidales bacterium]|nr:T9SS type A sorting domain-containing protein [Bacteroidales bacterium]
MKKFYLIFIVLTLLAYESNSQNSIAGNALQYGGSSCLNLGSIDFNFADQLSILCWVRWDTLPNKGNNWANLITINSKWSSDNGVFWLQHNSDNSRFEFAISTNNNGSISRNMIFSNTSPQQGQWYHIAALYDGHDMYLYINGLEESSKGKTGNVNTAGPDHYFTIGAWAVSNNNYRKFHGTIDEVSIWNRCLSAAEIQAIMNVNITGNESGLQGYWRFDETSGNIVNDLSPSGFNTINDSCGLNPPAQIIGSDAPSYGTLPVNLLYFQPICGSDSNVVVEWATATETNNDYFVIHRSFDGMNWEILAKVDGSGNTNSIHTYRYVDTKPMNKTIYYRLSQHDFDGKYEEFDMTSVFCRDNAKDLKVYPNPISDEFTVSFNNISDMEGSVVLQVFDQQGRLMASKTDEAFGGYNEIKMNISQLPSGMYFLHVRFMNLYLHSGEILKN